jgi:hypothetical protein
MTTKRQPKFQVGQTIEWSSQSAGSWKTKTGKVLAVLMPGDSAREALGKLGYDPKGAHDFVDRATPPRYLVDATPPGFKGKPRIYVPDFGRAENNGKVVLDQPAASV